MTSFSAFSIQFHALKREVPVEIPSEAYEECNISSNRIPGAELRMSEPVSLIFESGKLGEVNYRRYGGEEQPYEENLLLLLRAGDSVNYLFNTKNHELNILISLEGEGELTLSIGSEEERIQVASKSTYSAFMKVSNENKQYLWVSCTAGTVIIDCIYLSAVGYTNQI